MSKYVKFFNKTIFKNVSKKIYYFIHYKNKIKMQELYYNNLNILTLRFFIILKNRNHHYCVYGNLACTPTVS